MIKHNKTVRFFLLLTAACFTVSCEAQDVFTRRLVYQIPAMEKAIIKKKIPYRTINDTTLVFDIYYPPRFNFNKSLPLVVFNNGVGSMDVPEWVVYKDWAKLVAANGMIAINHQSRQGSALEDGEGCWITSIKMLLN